MFKSLTEIIKELKGNVLTIGIDIKLIPTLMKNKYINVYSIDKSSTGILGKSKKRKNNKGKDINIKKLKKYFNKKSIDYIICDYSEIEDYTKYIFRNFIYLNCNMLYLYCDKNHDIDLIIKRFKRYGSNIDIKEYKDNYLLLINNKNSKTNFLKNIIFFILDTLYNLIDFIGNILVN